MQNPSVMRAVDTRPLKQFARESLPVDSALRAIVLADRDSITLEEFLARIEIYLRLLESEILKEREEY